jgi:hypothetical protein
MPLLLLAGSAFGILNIAAAAKNRVADDDKPDVRFNSAKLSSSVGFNRSIGNLLAA